ncbi:MAG: hybrid sensor histidine kinase/response regulator [Bacteroidota bacterium]|jgi:signal transduction histidine kinase/CheY-like chemotaxis protein
MKISLFLSAYKFQLLIILLLITGFGGGLIPEIAESFISRKIQTNQHELLRSIRFQQKLMQTGDTIRYMDQIQMQLLDGYDSLLVKEYAEYAVSTDLRLRELNALCLDTHLYLINQIEENFSKMKAYGHSIILIKAANDSISSFNQNAENACQKFCAGISSAENKLLKAERQNTVSLLDENLSLINDDKLLQIARLISMSIAVLLIIIISRFFYLNKKRQEKALYLAQRKAEDTLQMKEQFVTNISHEIRTPLNALLGFTDLLSSSALSQKQRRQLEAIKRSGESLQHVINDVLDFSKLEAGMMRRNSIVFNVRDQAEHVQTMFLPMAIEKKINLDVTIDTDVPKKVKGDPGHIRQILINLVSNAIKFTHEGKIELNIKQIPSSTELIWLSFQVSDTGIGIPADQHQEIFRRFYQAVNNNEGQYTGTGLGLSIVRKLTELLGGNVAVTSSKGEGTSFTINLPFNAADEEPVSLNTVSAAVHKNILVAEDHPLSRQLIHETLEEQYWSYDLVRRGDEVLEKLNRNTYDLILLDYNLPVLNAVELFKKIRTNLNLTTPVVGLSAGINGGERESCLEAGMNDFIPKPFTPSQFIESIRHHISVSDKQQSGQLTNLAYLNKISNGNHDFVKKMAKQFITENRQELKELKAAFDNDSYTDVLHVVHRMRSTISFVGLESSAGVLISEIEKTPLETAGLDTIKSTGEKLIAVCRKAIEELENS